MFPQLLYHKSGRHQTVNNEAESATVLAQNGWQEKPFPPAPPAPTEQSLAERIAALEERVGALEARKKK